MQFLDRMQEAMAPRAKRALVIVLVTVVLIGAGFLGAAFLPRWWGHRVGAQAGGGFTMGILLGLFYGFVFTALPLAALRFVFHKRRPWKTLAWMFGVGLLLALPNLLTLGIVLGNGKAAHAGQRTLDVDAPGFRGASLAGALTALFVFLFWEYLRFSRRRARDQVKRLRTDKKEKK